MSKWRSEESQLTLIPLFLDLDLLGQILVLLPLDLAPLSLVVDKVTTVADSLLLSSALHGQSGRD